MASPAAVVHAEVPHKVTRSTQYADLPELMEVEQVAAYTGRSKWWVYARVHDKTLKNCGIGKIILVPKECLHPSRLVKP